jgi:phosphoribosylaminoimidazole-succinocarboxamide synthase
VSSHSVRTSVGLSSLPFVRRGKVRDLFEVDKDHLLLVATDRISAFDGVLPNPIPRKGQVLTQISRFWFERLGSLVANHLITADVYLFPKSLRSRLTADELESLNGRAMLVRRTDVVPFECVVRGYLAGSGWKDYLQTGEVCGHTLPQGLLESSRLPEPIFTPATKAEAGHDINVSRSVMAEALGKELTGELERISLDLYKHAAAHAEACGIIIADTKFEFGLRDGRLLLIDEVLTPDSSRFWPRSQYQPGRPQPSFDKQYVRDYLETLDWDKRPPAPELPPLVVATTSETYLEAYRLLTGTELL